MFLMEQMMRWYGPNDPVSLNDIRQAGCTGVVTALHQIPVGNIWTIKEIKKRKQLIEASGLTWTVIESLPVHEDIKKRSGDYQRYIDNYKQSIENAAICGLKVITYNFMSVLDWVRTEPYFKLPSGATTLRYEKLAFIAFDLFLLKRPNAAADYTRDDLVAAEKYFAKLKTDERQKLFDNVLLGLPGSDEAFTPEQVLNALETYKSIDRESLKSNLILFLKAVIPTCEATGINMAIHPDDPPFPVLGLPRIMSTEQDALDIIQAVPSSNNGFCFCTGSFGARPDNDLVGMMQRLGDYIHFLHLRNTSRDTFGNFQEANHLEGDTDMVAVVQEVLNLMQRRKIQIPMRPDHGHQMLDDLNKVTYPGYSGIGRLKALAELRGLERGLAYKHRSI